MVGNVIYLIFCRDMVHHSDTMETPHATFDGVYEHMQAIKEHFESKDFEEDYNDEYLDGGHWTKVIRIDEASVKQIVEE